MDQEKFEQQLMGYLFDELDEVGTAAVKRHLDANADARELEARLRTTLAGTELVLEEPTEDLELRILEAARAAELGEPWHRKAVRFLAWAGSHAMRPQFAMGALMVMLLGSSLLLLRAKPGAMRVSAEAGVAAETQRSAAPAAPANAASQGTQDASPASAKAEGAGSEDPETLLLQAREVRSTKGCAAALPLLAKIREKQGASGFGADATYEEMECHEALAHRDKADELARTLEDNPEYRRKVAERAAEKVATVGDAPAAAGGASASKATPAKKAAKKAPPTKQPSKPRQ